MTHPTDDKLEAMARVLEGKEGFAYIASMGPKAAAMLRACKGRGWQSMESAPIFGKVLRYDPRRREGEQVFECPADGGFWRHEKMPGMWMHMPEPPGTLDPASDQGELDSELLDRIEGIFAYDTGCVDSGISDPVFKQKLIDRQIDVEPYLTEIARQYLNGDQGYTLEDVKSLIEWASDELEYDL